MSLVFLLLVIFQLKHFLADYPLQRPWMLGKFKPGIGFVLPLAAHCFVHGLLTWCIVGIAYAWRHGEQGYATSISLAVFDFCAHFVMDRVKASPKLMGRWKPLTAETYPTATKAARRSNRLFWDAIGFDQMVHHLTHYVIIWVLCR